MVAFFLISQCMERFLYTKGMLDGKAYILFDFKCMHTFWDLTCLFLVFVILYLLSLMVVAISKQKLDAMEHRAIFVTALDLALHPMQMINHCRHAWYRARSVVMSANKIPTAVPNRPSRVAIKTGSTNQLAHESGILQ